jgi:tetratricopeptide (TPR) repeat protein
VATVALDETLGDRDRDELQGQALTYLDRAVEAAPDLPDARAFRAILLKRLGRTDEAAAELRAFDATDPPPEMQAIVDASGLREELGVPAPAEDP